MKDELESAARDLRLADERRFFTASRRDRFKCVLRTSAFCLLTSALLVAGCASRVNTIVEEGNYRTYEHVFTEDAAETVRRMAERSCAIKKQVAMKTSSTCSLQRCTTHYQCMDPADAERHK